MLSRGSTQLMIVDCPEREYAGSCWCWCSSKILCTNNGVGFVVVVADADLLLLFFCMLFSSSFAQVYYNQIAQINDAKKLISTIK